jgi:ABC-type phosphate transport system permease subunit
MKALNGESLSRSQVAIATVPRTRLLFGIPVAMAAGAERRLYLVPLGGAVAGLLVGVVALFLNEASALIAPVAGVTGLGLFATSLDGRRRSGRWDRAGVGLALLSWLVVAVAVLAPLYLYGWQVNGVIHRSAYAAPLLLAASVAAASYSLRRLLGDTPTARDVSIYPLIALPVALALVAYVLLLGQILVKGAPGISLDVLLTPWGQTIVGDPADGNFVYQYGLRNHILGTLLLMFLTCAFSIAPGIGVGVFMSEYPGRVANVIGFATTMLRAMSVFIIGVAAIGFVRIVNGWDATAPLSVLIRGSFTFGETGATQPGSGSFISAALFLSLLVIPIIAKLTEEGLRSVPRDIREGSIAAGATDGYGLRRVLLPWAGPNIVTGLLLGAAEAAGSLAIIMFLAGNGEYGVGPTSTVTGLDYALFSTRYGKQEFISTMGYRAEFDYAYTAALLLLLITLGLTVVAMLVRQRFSKRYRGSLTIG